MPISLSKVTKLNRTIQALTKEMSAKERQLAAAINELHRCVAHHTTSSHLSSLPPIGSGAVTSLTRLRRRGTFTQQILDFLANRRGRSFLPKRIAEELGVPHRRRRTLSVTLHKLGKRGKIRRAPDGWTTAVQADPEVRARA
jgi:hypothetical protein